MRYTVVILTLILACYLLSYAKYSWKNNKTSSMGAVIMAVASIILPAIAILFRYINISLHERGKVEQNILKSGTM